MADLISSEVWLDHIFTKLPVKSLLRCKLVCKAWNHLISDPEFVRTHLPLHQLRQRVLLRLQSSGCDYVSVDTSTGDSVKLKVDDMSIIGSSNGLLCGRLRNSRKDRLMIWNPSTGEFKLISEGPLYVGRRDIFRFGFCYDSLIDDGYIVLFTSSNRRTPDPLMKPKIDIYSIKSDSWKTEERMHAPFSLDGLEPVKKGCGMNGSIYWLVNNNNRRPKFVEILVFNIKKDDKFRKLQLPCCRGSEDGAGEKKLMVLGSRLGLSVWFPNNYRIVVWTLKEGETEEWIKLMDLNVTFLCYNSSFGLLPKPMCLTKNRKLLLLLCEEQRREPKFCLYDPVNKKTEYLSIRGISDGFHIAMVAYVESLVSLSSISQR